LCLLESRDAEEERTLLYSEVLAGWIDVGERVEVSKIMEATVTVFISLVIPAILLVFFLVATYSRTSKSGTLKANAKELDSHPAEAHRTFTEAEVSTHNKRSDLWIILKNKVYDVTPFVEEHPGGDAILNNAGGDSTVGFFGPQHGTKVFEMLDDFLIGDLEQ